MTKAYLNMIDSVTFQYSDRIKKATSALMDCYNINEFYYFKVNSNGDFGFLGSYLAWNEYFVANHLYLNIPYYRHPKFILSGIIPLPQIEDSGFAKVLAAGKERFNVHRCFAWIAKLSDGFEGFGISSNTSSEYQNLYLLNELPYFQLFAKYFKSSNAILFEKLEENKCNLVDLIGPSFYDPNSLTISQASKRELFLKSMGMNCRKSLTEREMEVTKFLLSGYSASKIATEINLSKRTVEHHVERIKEKLACNSKSELIQKARELELLGSL